MLIALLSDVHGNLPGLQAAEQDMRQVLSSQARRSFDQVWLMGDLVDPLPWPIEVMRTVQAWSGDLVPGEPQFLGGNHDAYVYGLTPLDDTVNPAVAITSQATAALLTQTPEAIWHLEHCTMPANDPEHPEHRPLRHHAVLDCQANGTAPKIHLCHGMVKEQLAFCYHSSGPDGPGLAAEDLRYACTRDGGEVDAPCAIFCGHRHEVFGWQRTSASEPMERLDLPRGVWLRLQRGQYLVCVGSVGIPRQQARGAEYALEYMVLDIDGPELQVQVRRVSLERPVLSQQVARRGLDIRFDAQVLYAMLRFSGLDG